MDSIVDIVIQLGGVVSAMAVLAAFGGRLIKKQFAPITESLTKMDISNCKCQLVNFLTDIENGVPKDEIQIKLAYEIYDHYSKDLKCNSYVHDKWEKLKSKFE